MQKQQMRKTPKNLSTEDKRQAATRYASGERTKTIAADLNVCISNLLKQIRNQGTKIRPSRTEGPKYATHPTKLKRTQEHQIATDHGDPNRPRGARTNKKPPSSHARSKAPPENPSKNANVVSPRPRGGNGARTRARTTSTPPNRGASESTVSPEERKLRS